MADQEELEGIKLLAETKNNILRELREAVRPYVELEYPQYCEGGWATWEFVSVDPEAKTLTINLVVYDERVPPSRRQVVIDLNRDEEEYQLAIRLKEKYNL